MADLGIDGFDLAEEIGRGGFGVVYRARQQALNRWVAVKMLATSLSGEGRERLQREARALGALSGHPAVVPIHDVGFSDRGQPYLVMPWFPRGSLTDRLRTDGALSWTEAVDIAVRIAGALESAHRAGMLHRDVKPANVLVDEFGRPRLGDFGIARVAGEFETTSRHITASVAHAAPEILDGHSPTVAADVYSLASTLYALIAGRPAFAVTGDESLVALYLRIASAPPATLVAEQVPAAVWLVIERSMAKDPASRPSSAEEFGRLLQDAQDAAGTPRTELVIGAGHSFPSNGDADQSSTVASRVDWKSTADGRADRVAAVGAGGEAGSAVRGLRRRRSNAVAAAVLVAAGVVGGGLLASRGGDPVQGLPTGATTVGTANTIAGTPIGSSNGLGSASPVAAATIATPLRCQVFPPDDPWNQRIDKLAVHPDSARWIAAAAMSLREAGLDPGLQAGFGTEVGVPYTVVHAGQPTVEITFGPNAALEESDQSPFPIPPDAPTQNGELAIVVDDDTCRLYEVLGSGQTGRPWDEAFAAIAWDLRTTPHRPAGFTSADQAGLPIFPGLVRYDEVAAGSINHALRFSTVAVDYGYIAPATHASGDRRPTDLPPFGARFRLRADFPCQALGPSARVVCVALQNYGMFLADEGQIFALIGTPDWRWTDIDEVSADLAKLTMADFEVADTGQPS